MDSKRWLEERQWDIVQGQWDADLDPDETLFPELHSKETWNAGRWINPEFDRSVELAQVEPDQKQRKQYWLFRSMSSAYVHAVFSVTPCESACNSSASESIKRQ